MRPYPTNSAEAMARLIAMFMITDGVMDPLEIDALESLHVYELIGLHRKRFTQVLIDYCNDISDEADEQDGTIHLIDKARIDMLLEEITEHDKRILICALVMDVCKSDGIISEPEIALLWHMMRTWKISLDDIEHQFIKQ